MKTKLSPIAIIIALAAISSSALATDGKNYAAVSCLTFLGSTADFFSSLENRTNDLAGVDCPAVKDQSPGISSGYVIAKDVSDGDNVFCTLRSCTYSGQNISCNEFANQTNGNSPNWQSINLGSVAALGTSAYFVTCTIPPVGSGNSAIASYHVEENQ